MDWKYILAKTTSIVLIATGFYHIFLSLNAIFFIYPRFTVLHCPNPLYRRPAFQSSEKPAALTD